LNFLWQKSELKGIEKSGVPEGDARIDLGSPLAQQFQRAAIAFIAIFTSDVEVAPVVPGLVEEVISGLEFFSVEELVFAEAMDGFDIAVVGMSGRGNEGMGHGSLLDGGFKPVRGTPLREGGGALIATPLVLGAVVRLEADLSEAHAASGQVIHHPLGEETGQGSGAFLGVIGEGEAGTDFPGSVLDNG